MYYLQRSKNITDFSTREQVSDIFKELKEKKFSNLEFCTCWNYSSKKERVIYFFSYTPLPPTSAPVPTAHAPLSYWTSPTKQI